MNATEKLDMQVAEELDGSAVVQLPPGEDNPQRSEPHDDDEPNNSSQNDGEGAGDHGDDDLDGTSADDPNREEIGRAHV